MKTLMILAELDHQDHNQNGGMPQNCYNDGTLPSVTAGCRAVPLLPTWPGLVVRWRVMMCGRVRVLALGWPLAASRNRSVTLPTTASAHCSCSCPPSNV